MNANCKSLDYCHASLSLWFVLAIGTTLGFLAGTAGLILVFAVLLQLKTSLVG